jgi:phosphatidylinositol dimannoside acyltransferase
VTLNRRLEAPHRRPEPASRLVRKTMAKAVEKVAVRGYRSVSWLIGHIPPGVARAVIGRGAQASYLAWPTKRRWSNANFGHVLGLPPTDRRVRLLALKAYREYARYVVELMRLPAMPRDQATRLVAGAELDGLEPIWRGSKGGLIFVLGHIGNNEAVAAGVAARGWPVSVVADDSAYPELFEDFRRLRESWGVHVIPWRNLREIYGVLRRREMLALLVDWGYRSDGIPVRLFDAWTTLPAGPAALAAKTGSRIVPVTIRRDSKDHFHVSWDSPIDVPSSAPADLVRATQQLADALAASIKAAPEQWYSFKPMWPETAAESAALERRAADALAGRAEAITGPSHEPMTGAAATGLAGSSSAGLL